MDHLGLVAGIFDELGIREVIDRPTQQNPEMRIVTAGHAQRCDRLHPRAKFPNWNYRGQLGLSYLSTGWADPAMQLILGDHRLGRWTLGGLMPLGLRLFPLQGLLEARAPLRLDRDNDIELRDWQQRPRLPLMTTLSAALHAVHWTHSGDVGRTPGADRSKGDAAHGCSLGRPLGIAPTALARSDARHSWAAILCGMGIAPQVFFASTR